MSNTHSSRHALITGGRGDIGSAIAQALQRNGARSDWDQTLAVNLTGPYLCTRLALADMLAAQWGRIVNVASTAGLKGYAYVAAYCASKHGLVGLTRALALEVATIGVTANAVCPGFVQSVMTNESVARIATKIKLSVEEAAAKLASHNPQQRLIAPDEIANAVAWLCSEATGGVNGATIAIAGGEV